jgi:predicted PurR-regulated permease PerM
MAIPTVSTPQPYQWTFRRVVGATLVFSFVAFCFYLLFRFYQVVFILFIAVVLGTVIRPIANWLTQRGLSRMASVILVYLVILLLVVGLLWLLFPLVFKQGADILGELPIYYQNLRTWLAESPSQLFHRLGAYLPSSLPNISAAMTGDPSAMSSAEVAVQYVTVAARAIFTTIVILALTLYWTLDGPRIIRSLLLLIPQERRESMSELI